MYVLHWLHNVVLSSATITYLNTIINTTEWAHNNLSQTPSSQDRYGTCKLLKLSAHPNLWLLSESPQQTNDGMSQIITLTVAESNHSDNR